MTFSIAPEYIATYIIEDKFAIMPGQVAGIKGRSLPLFGPGDPAGGNRIIALKAGKIVKFVGLHFSCALPDQFQGVPTAPGFCDRGVDDIPPGIAGNRVEGMSKTVTGHRSVDDRRF